MLPGPFFYCSSLDTVFCVCVCVCVCVGGRMNISFISRFIVVVAGPSFKDVTGL
jgi:acetyl-CoA carboxylase carboxyltransferase component